MGRLVALVAAGIPATTWLLGRPLQKNVVLTF